MPVHHTVKGRWVWDLTPPRYLDLRLSQVVRRPVEMGTEDFSLGQVRVRVPRVVQGQGRASLPSPSSEQSIMSQVPVEVVKVLVVTSTARVQTTYNLEARQLKMFSWGHFEDG